MSTNNLRPQSPLTFRDGCRRIDMILAYPDDSDLSVDSQKKMKYRKVFEYNLYKQGLELELEPSNVSVYNTFL